MVPLGQVFDKLSRVVRQISRDAGKEIHLVITGADTELDKLIVEELSDPLMHMIRNASTTASSGRDERARRRASPRRARSRSAPAARQPRRHRGRGRRRAASTSDKLVRKAVERGLVGAGEARELSRATSSTSSSCPGFSHQGRRRRALRARRRHGRGQDEHRPAVGIIDVESETGQGTQLTHHAADHAGDHPGADRSRRGTHLRDAAQLACSSRCASTQADVRTIERREVMTLRGQTLPLARLARLFRLARDRIRRRARRLDGVPWKQFVVVVGLAQHRIGLLVDELHRAAGHRHQVARARAVGGAGDRRRHRARRQEDRARARRGADRRGGGRRRRRQEAA